LQFQGGQFKDKKSDFKTRGIVKQGIITGEGVTINNINVEETVQKVTGLIATEKGLSPALKGSLEVLLLLVSLLLNRLGLNSKNSSKPPSADPFWQKRTSAGKRPQTRWATWTCWDHITPGFRSRYRQGDCG